MTASESNLNFTAADIFLRTPFYPFNSFWEMPFLMDRMKSADFLEALYLGSPDLYHKFTDKLADPEKNKNVLRSLYKYYLRMSYRCTPFGLFSGVSHGKGGSTTGINLCGKDGYRKHTRLDNHLLSGFIQQILGLNEVRESVLWFSNNTTYSVGTTLRFVEYSLRKSQRVYQLSNVLHSQYLQKILERARQGARLHELVEIIETGNITLNDALEFVNELIDSKLILSELEPLVTGEEPHRTLIDLLEKYPATRSQAEYLKSLCKKIEIIDAQPPGAHIDLYQEIVGEIHSRFTDYDEKLIFQTDLIKPAKTFLLSNGVLEELKNGISFLANLSAPEDVPQLKKFKEEFARRYESAEVPLLSVLDSEAGLGYPVGTLGHDDNTPLAKDLRLVNTIVESSYTQSEWGRILMERYRTCVEKNEIEIILSEKDVSHLTTKNAIGLMPGSFSTFFTILADSAEAIDKGNFEIIHNGTRGPSGVSLLGRFCHADVKISDTVKKLIRDEEQLDPDRVYAEVVHLAQARIGNVLVRPTLRDYEIPILTFPSVDSEHTINLADLTISVKDNRIVLRSRRLNKEIIPRNTTAHNFGNDALPYYHFLGDLQFQDHRNSVNWQWGLLSELSFLPRVRFGKTVFSKGRWIVDIRKLDLPKNFTDEVLGLQFERHMKLNRIPDKVVLTQADNQLPLRLGQPMCMEILMQELKRNRRITLEECLFTDANLFVTGPEGRFTNEFIIPWTMTQKSESSLQPHFKDKEGPSVERSFTPGSSWHYIKIYCGVKTADKLLTEVIKPLVEELLSAGVIHKWFFIRYADPDHHLRIRFSGDAQFYSVVTDKLNELLQPYLESNLVWKIQTDTYQRELERYGPENIENSESLFFYDSVASIQILSLLEGDEGDDLRWQFAFKGVNDLLNSFGLDLPAKRELLSGLSIGFLKEFDAGGSESKKQLGAKYRGIKDKIQIALQPSLPSDHEFVEVWEILSARSKNLETPISAINSLEEQGKLSVSKSNLIGSYVHMFLNRFLRSKQRLQEMVIYDLLHRHYRSLIARETKSALVL